MLCKIEWSRKWRTWSHKMYLLDILSTSLHYFCRKWIGATNEIQILILGFKGLRECSKQLSYGGVKWEGVLLLNFTTKCRIINWPYWCTENNEKVTILFTKQILQKLMNSLNENTFYWSCVKMLFITVITSYYSPMHTIQINSPLISIHFLEELNN